MDKPQPLVSVVIPAYNAGKWLGDAVGSVLAQTYPEWELIIVNDGSTDGTGDLARSFGDPRILVVDQANQGVSAARNTGIRQSKGEFLCFMDADDAMLPENLATKVKAIAEHGVDWVFADMAACNEDLQPTGRVMVGTDGDVLRALLLSAPSVPISCNNILARRRCFAEGVAFDTELSNAADQHFTMQMAARFTYKHIPGTFNLYRDLPGSMSKNVQLFQDDHLRFFRKAREAGHLDDKAFRRRCMANVYWAIGGSWWLDAGKRAKAIPYFLRAVFLAPQVLVRPLKKRLSARANHHRQAAMGS